MGLGGGGSAPRGAYIELRLEGARLWSCIFSSLGFVSLAGWVSAFCTTNVKFWVLSGASERFGSRSTPVICDVWQTPPRLQLVSQAALLDFREGFFGSHLDLRSHYQSVQIPVTHKPGLPRGYLVGPSLYRLRSSSRDDRGPQQAFQQLWLSLSLHESSSGCSGHLAHQDGPNVTVKMMEGKKNRCAESKLGSLTTSLGPQPCSDRCSPPLPCPCCRRGHQCPL